MTPATIGGPVHDDLLFLTPALLIEVSLLVWLCMSHARPPWWELFLVTVAYAAAMSAVWNFFDPS